MTYTKKYTHHLKPNERARDGDHWTWHVPGRKNTVYSLHRVVRGLYAVCIYDDNGQVLRDAGLTPRDAYRRAWRAWRLSRRNVPRVLRQRAKFAREIVRLRSELRTAHHHPPSADSASLQVRDLRAGLDAVRAALDGVTTHAVGKPLNERVRLVASRMVELDRLYTAELRRAEELKNALEHRNAVITQLLALVRKSAGENSPVYARALSMSRAVGVSAPAQEVTA